MLSFASFSPAHGRLNPREGGLDVSRNEKPSKDVPDTAVCFDHLMGIKWANSRYTFVQYTPTMCHKNLSGIKRDALDQVNGFLRGLRQHNVPLETALFSTISPSSITKVLRVKIFLSELQELSLEPLWNIQGHAKLDSRQQWAIVSLRDQAIDSCVFNKNYELEVDSSGSKNQALLDLAVAALRPADKRDTLSDEHTVMAKRHTPNSGSGEDNRRDIYEVDRAGETDKRSFRREPVPVKATRSSMALRLRKRKPESLREEVSVKQRKGPSVQGSETTQRRQHMLRPKTFITGKGRYSRKNTAQYNNHTHGSEKNTLSVRNSTFSDDDGEKVPAVKCSPSSAVEDNPGAPPKILQREETDPKALSCDMIQVLPESTNESVHPRVDPASAPKVQSKRNCCIM